MSTLWNVTVAEVGPDWVDLEVVLAHPDAGPFPEDRVFALCLLTGEAYRLESMTDWVPNGPLGEAIPKERAYQPFDVAPRVDEFVRRVLIHQAFNLPWDDASAAAEIDRRMAADGIDRNSNRWHDAWREKWGQFGTTKTTCREPCIGFGSPTQSGCNTFRRDWPSAARRTAKPGRG